MAEKSGAKKAESVNTLHPTADSSFNEQYNSTQQRFAANDNQNAISPRGIRNATSSYTTSTTRPRTFANNSNRKLVAAPNATPAPLEVLQPNGAVNPATATIKKPRNLRFHKAILHTISICVSPLLVILSVLSLVTLGIYLSLDQSLVGTVTMYVAGWWYGAPKTAAAVWELFLNVWFYQIVLGVILHLFIYSYFKFAVRVNPIFGRGDGLQSLYAFLSFLFSVCPGGGLIPFYIIWIQSVK